VSKAWGHYSGELLNCRVVCELWLDLQGSFCGWLTWMSSKCYIGTTSKENNEMGFAA
jgi:hypothetical protein